MERREFLAHVGAGALGVSAWSRSALGQTAAFNPDIELELRAAPAVVSILPGDATRVWRYTGNLRKGPATTIQPVADSYLGPILRFQAGQRVRVHFINDLPEASIVHWHGLDVPTDADGHPRLAVASGQHYVYEFTVINRAGTYWYHPHPHMRTAYQAYHGLAGLIIVTDAEEGRLQLPAGDDELVCVIQDRRFDAANQLAYLAGGGMAAGGRMSGMGMGPGMMEAMNGFLGDRILVNGRPPAPRALATRVYRLRLMNGSNSRVYKLAWDNARPITVIGTDGGLLQAPVTRPYLALAPGERVDTLLDLRDVPVGTTMTLRSGPFASRMFTGMMGMGGGGGRGGGRGRGSAAGAGLAQGDPFDVMTIRVDRQDDRRGNRPFTLPATLSAYGEAWQPPAGVPTRLVKIDWMHMQFFLDGREFEMAGVAPAETVPRGSTHIWEFDNSGPAMMNMRLGHPMHLHGRQFRVLKRTIEPAREADWRTLKDGFVDEGWKDTTLVLPGERVQLLVRFSQYPGLYLYHCHNLEHEDMGMMRNFRIV